MLSPEFAKWPAFPSQPTAPSLIPGNPFHLETHTPAEQSSSSSFPRPQCRPDYLPFHPRTIQGRTRHSCGKEGLPQTQVWKKWHLSLPSYLAHRGRHSADPRPHSLGPHILPREGDQTRETSLKCLHGLFSSLFWKVTIVPLFPTHASRVTHVAAQCLFLPCLSLSPWHRANRCGQRMRMPGKRGLLPLNESRTRGVAGR